MRPGPEEEQAACSEVSDNAKSPGARKLDGACAKILGGDLLSHMMICSIIGDKELNCRVRNGIGCTLLSMAAKKSL